MSREIKFRAWDKLEKPWNEEFKKEMIYNVAGIEFWINSIRIVDEDRHNWIDFKDVEIMQYTGIKDKNGKEIYEEDIVEFDDVFEDEYGEACDGFNRAVVKFENGEYTLTDFLDENSQTFESVEDRNTSFKTLIESIEAKVVGNKFENADLMGGECNSEN